jgi:hypothetical protein
MLQMIKSMEITGMNLMYSQRQFLVLLCSVSQIPSGPSQFPHLKLDWIGSLNWISFLDLTSNDFFDFMVQV